MIAALEGGEWSAARPGRTLPPGKTRYPFYRRLSGPQGRSGRAENLFPTGIRSRCNVYYKFGFFSVKLVTFEILLTSMWRKRIITRRYRVSKYHFVQYALRVSNPGGDVIVRCTRKNVYLASCPYITEKLTMIQLSLEVWTFTVCYVLQTLHTESSALLKWLFYSIS